VVVLKEKNGMATAGKTVGAGKPSETGSDHDNVVMIGELSK